MMWYGLIAIGVLIIAALSFYLGKLLSQLHQQQQQKKAAEQQHQQKLAEHQQYLRESIVFIGKATLEQQCEVSEAALRIWVLLDNLQPELATPEQWPALFAMYDCVKAMPTHEARAKTDKKEIRKLDHIRQQKEIELKSAIEADIRSLLTKLQLH